MALAQQKRSTTGGPKNVTKEETVDPDDDGTVRTLIVNLARYYKGGISINRYPIIPLEDQMRIISPGEEQEDFFRRYLYAGSKRVVRIFLSHPAFDKGVTRGKGAQLYNVAVRVTPPTGSTRRYDLIMMGNFEHRARDNRWEFCVTGFYPEASAGRYFGETEAQVRFVTIIRNPDDSFIELDTDGRRSQRRVAVPARYNFITEHLAEKLCAQHSVPNYRAAERNLSEWQDFLDHIENLKGESGFPVERPEFIHAYGIREERAHDPTKVILSDNGIVWTREVFTDVPQRAIVKLTHRVDPALPKGRLRDYIGSFNEMSANLPVVIDPVVETERSHTFYKKEERREWSELSHIGTIINEVSRIQVLPEEDVKRIRGERDEQIASLNATYSERLDAALKDSVGRYMGSPEGAARADALIARSQDRIAELSAEALSDIAEERYAAAVAEGREISLQEIRSQITDGECRKAAVGIVLEELAADVSRELLPAVTVTFGETNAAALQAAERKCERKLNKIAKKRGSNILVAYYRLPSDGEHSVEEEIGARTDHFERLGSYVLKNDEMLNRTAVRRLTEAIATVRCGQMRNPYMPSFLYLPEFVPSPRPVRINHYFGSGFNEFQKRAISRAVGANGIYMIQGPPGTGKTQVIAEITAQEVARGRKVLITSQGNKAVDNAFERINNYGFIRSLRIMSMSKESDYDISNLLPKFYAGICEALDNRRREFSDPAFLSRVRGEIDRFLDLYGRYRKLEARTRDMAAEADRKVNEAVYESRRAADGQKKMIENAYAELYRLQDRRGLLTSFDAEELGARADDVRGMFPWIPAENRDGLLFGPSGACRALTAMSEEETRDLAQALSDPVASVEVSGWTVSRAFAGGDISRLPGTRMALIELLNVALQPLQQQIDGAEDRVRSILQARTEEALETETDIDDTAYHEFAQVKTDLLALASDIYSDLQIGESIDGVDGAKEVVEDAASLMAAFADGGIPENIFTDIQNYLSEEGIQDRNGEAVLRGISDQINVFGITCTANLYVDAKGDGTGGRSDIIDLRRCGIDTVIIDEVSKVPFSELIRPIAFCRKVIMVGDHRQLPPVYIEDGEDDPDLSLRFSELYSDSIFRDMFERVPEASRIMLRVQYRMAKQIMEVVNMFYEEPLAMPEGIPDDWRAHRISVPGLLTQDCSVLFVDVKGTEGHRSGSTSVYNAEEAAAVARIVRLLDGACGTDADGRPLGSPGAVPMTMGVITPYRDQNLAVYRELRMDPDSRIGLSMRAFRTEGEEGFKVKSVDDFQGDERDVIILSLVRTRSSNFISDFRRINVAMSRARRLLVIVGNADVLALQEVDLGGTRGRERVYAEIIEKVKGYGGFVDGSRLTGAGI